MARPVAVAGGDRDDAVDQAGARPGRHSQPRRPPLTPVTCQDHPGLSPRARPDKSRGRGHDAADDIAQADAGDRVRVLTSHGVAGTMRPMTSPRLMRVPPTDGAVAVIVTSSPSSRN